MISKIYVYQDVVSGIYGELFTAKHKAEVVRSLRSLVSSGRVDPYVIRDTVVYEIGDFNHDQPVPFISAYQAPVLVIRGDAVYAECMFDKNGGNPSDVE